MAPTQTNIPEVSASMCVATLERTQLLASGNNGNKPPVRVLVALAGGDGRDNYNERGRGSDGTYY
ncbi:hypothetical protein [Paenibacillus sp. FSL R5-0928]|uniref:hypothetical protein n=1 Tax=unclassified Paenibacillus TaxID=185978 RepID=UPI0030DBDAD4